MTKSLESLTVDVFQPRVGETFRIHARADTKIEAELIEARALGGGPSRAAPSDTSQRRMPFSLSFRTSLTAPLPQSVYEVAHDHLGLYVYFPGNWLVRTGREWSTRRSSLRLRHVNSQPQFPTPKGSPSTIW